MRDILPLIEVPFYILLLTPAFVLFFAGVTLWVYRRSGRAGYQRTASLPLEDGVVSIRKQDS